MSIIQEALKKAQVNIKQGVAAPELKASRDSHISAAPGISAAKPLRPRRRNSIIIIVAMAAFMSVLVMAASFNFLSSRNHSDKKTAMPLPSAAQEVSYASLLTTDRSDLSVNAIMASKAPELYLSGIMYTEESPRAIVNDRIVEPGDSVSGAKVKKINPKSVVLEFIDTEITLSLK